MSKPMKNAAFRWRFGVRLQFGRTITVRRRGCVLGWRRISWDGGGFGAGILGWRRIGLGLWRTNAGTVGSCTSVPASEKPLNTTMQNRQYFHLDGAAGARAHHQEDNQKMTPRTKKSKKQ